MAADCALAFSAARDHRYVTKDAGNLLPDSHRHICVQAVTFADGGVLQAQS